MQRVLELLDAAAGPCVSEGRLSLGDFLLVVQSEGRELLQQRQRGWENLLVHSSGKSGGSSEYLEVPYG